MDSKNIMLKYIPMIDPMSSQIFLMHRTSLSKLSACVASLERAEEARKKYIYNLRQRELQKPFLEKLYQMYG